MRPNRIGLIIKSMSANTKMENLCNSEVHGALWHPRNFAQSFGTGDGTWLHFFKNKGKVNVFVDLAKQMILSNEFF
ncbi:hypothetical protein YDYSG_06350 [Paenibacillus tyrfis]|nr:hypothetical protein YDYSG_06350 [Paenibacillus tyrfis]